jgi:hypothetical protein
MKALGKSSNVTIAAMVAIAALAIAFWMLALSPKREEAAKLGKEVETAEASLAQHRAEVAEAEEARRDFPEDYQKLVVLGKAVPGDDETASLLVQVSGVAERAGVKFNDLTLGTGGGGGEEAAAAAPPAAGAEPVSPTEAAASVLPLGAAVGPAGLAVMPYTLTFQGGFFEVADFIEGLDAMVKTRNEDVTVEGRLLTIDSFTLGSTGGGGAAEEGGKATPVDELTASFTVTTYLTPPSEGVTGGATPESPAATSATPAATTLGGSP